MSENAVDKKALTEEIDSTGSGRAGDASGTGKYGQEYARTCCEEGERLEEQHLYREAARKYLLSGMAGDPEGVYGYAKSLYMGWTGKADLETAHELFRMLRDRGHQKSACFFLGLYEEQGLLGKPDYPKAIEYYTEGGLNGDYRSYRQLGRIYAEGKITEEDPEKAYHNFMMAGAIGDPISVTNMAVYVEEGYGVEQNLDWAVKLYRLAAGAGELNAIEALERLGVSLEEEENHELSQ